MAGARLAPRWTGPSLSYVGKCPGIFLPLKDATSGKASYGGGRYVLDTVKGADLGGDPGALVVDLNFSHQPSCARNRQ
jgi:uncharacterized protein (DUF1684 family)